VFIARRFRSRDGGKLTNSWRGNQKMTGRPVAASFAASYRGQPSMSRQHINAYRRDLARLHAASGSLNEGVVSKAFGDLLERMGRAHDLVLVPQKEWKGPRGNNIRVDGALIPGVLRIPFGWWEAKDSKDTLDKEIEAKRRAGYPDDNIIYENSITAILRQNGVEVDRAPLQGDDDALLKLLARFFAYERAEIGEFRKASAQFRADLPQILTALRDAIDSAEANNTPYRATAKQFLDHAREAINPLVTPEDVREMLIQHILTEAIFARVFDNDNYHRENNVAKQLTALEQAFFTGPLRQATVAQLQPYYAAITKAAAATADRREKQAFLKRLYEDFYKSYNPLAADRLGVVYTPNEIVRFMVRATDTLCERHFGKLLCDSGVEILDPATGTGTFIVELLEHFEGDRDKLRHKYKNELHANEVAILPYYVANLNIEATYAAITGQYADFPGLVFVDTLDNTAGLGKFAGYQDDMFGSIADENLARVKRQNERKISVVIGNPPYNAWQSNYNNRNANRPYKRIDDRIGASYRDKSNATNTSALSDMYVRFFRWASDRLRDEGILAFVCNNGFLDSVAFDGFRRCIQQEFSEAWVVDLKGNARSSGEARRKQGGNVFDDKIKVGICVAMFVKKKDTTPFVLHYRAIADYTKGPEKRAYIESCEVGVDFRIIKPQDDGVWLNAGKAGWAAMMPLADPAARPGDLTRLPQAIFRLSSNGVQTKRDDWVYAWTPESLEKKVRFFVSIFKKSLTSGTYLSDIKWDREITARYKKNKIEEFDKNRIRNCAFRPFLYQHLYYSTWANSLHFRTSSLYKGDEKNPTIAVHGKASQAPFVALAAQQVFDTSFLKCGNGSTQGVARYRYTATGERVDNITDWALTQFRTHYGDLSGGAAISKDDIFAYVYAALHDPVWRETYAADLRRSFPRIPFHADFVMWRDWGQRLLALHIDYETQAAHANVKRVDAGGKKPPKPVLRSDAINGKVLLDTDTQLTGIPRAAWDYRLGNRSAIDWVLDQHKEKTPRDPTVAAKFNTYRFADHKEKVIDLLGRVVAISVETVAIVDAMRTAQAG
jgi:predicted helicase